ncbi:MAG: FAD-binding oxidoreductase [Eggerthellaceae bacterium]|nr:FAD-binding oxidoreductase [Eggerthellaceae bacterium]
MGTLSTQTATRLKEIVGDDRYRDDQRERKAYSFDIGVMPPLIRPFVNADTAGGVVRPADEEELIKVVKLAAAEGLKMVARGAATSGYGGVLPQTGSLVVDMNSLNHVVAIDTEAETVTCQSAAVWEDVDNLLAESGLELRLHPSSYPSSTVAGWLAQGGSGFGSYEYGAFKENVESARVVLPDGTVKEFTGDELLDLIADAEGITGIITEVTFKVRRREPQQVKLISLPDSATLGKVLLEIEQQALPIWSLTFLNPEAIRIKQMLPPRLSHEYEIEEVTEEFTQEQMLPRTYLLLLAYPASRNTQVEPALTAAVNAAGGYFLSDEHAEQEWAGHTKPMRLKRIGPSIIPTEVVVPLAGLAAVLAELDAKVKQPLVLEGSIEKGGKVTLLGFIPHDERRFGFNVAFALALSVIRAAKQHGGSAFSSGLYFRREAKTLLGEKRIAQLRAFKDAHDPQRIMNPGKVIALPGTGGGLLDALMGAAQALEPLIRPFANAAKTPFSVDSLMPTKVKNAIPGDVAYFATACARCGYCVRTCEQYSARGWESQSPRGKYAYLREVLAGNEDWDRKAVDTFLLCTTCERCDQRCQLQLPVGHNGMALRGSLIQEKDMGTFPPFEMMAASLRGEGDIWAGKRAHRADWLPQDIAARVKTKGDILYFAGCTASYVETDIAEATLRLLLDSGLDVAYLGTKESCCGVPMKMAGKWDLFTQIYRENVAAVKATGAKTIITSCPACALVWKDMYAEEAEKRGEEYSFEVKHYSEVIAEALADGRLELKRNPFEGTRVTFHDSCHAGRAQGLYEPPRKMLEAIPGIDLVEMKHNRENGLCCGSVLTLVGDIDTAPKIGKARLGEAISAGAETVIALCPCCQVQLRDSVEKNHLDIVIDDLARAVASAAGHEIPTSAATTSYMWGLFDTFIRLMAPAEMASFMQRLFPHMLDAMPLGMGSMMRAMIKLPGGAAMMRKMMPILFPKMAPGILAKVMPDMVAEIKGFIGDMPDDMDALMPDLLPKTMDALMGTYIPQLVPHLVPLFIDFLKDGEKKAA